MPSVSIVFLNHNRLKETKETLGRLSGCLDSREDVEVVAVDNGSTDGTREFLESSPAVIKKILLDKNYGIGAYNRGFEAASGEILIVLDDDSHIECGTIERARGLFASDAGLGAVAFKVVDKDGLRFDTWHIPRGESAGESFSFVGCGFAVRKDAFMKAGYYPEGFFLYHNEVEVAIRLRLGGYKIIYDPGCVAVHRTSSEPRDPSRRIYYTLRNSLFLIWKYYPAPAAIYMTLSRLLISFSLALYYGKAGDAFGAVRGFLKDRPRREVLPRRIRNAAMPFFRRNSILHRLTGRA